MLFFSQEKFLLTKIPLDDRGYIDLIVLKFWLLNVPDKLLDFLLSSSPSPSQRFSSSQTSSFSVSSLKLTMAATAMATETAAATEEVCIFLKKNYFFHHALSFLFFFFVLYCIVLIFCMIEYEMNRKFDRFLGFRRRIAEKKNWVVRRFTEKR